MLILLLLFCPLLQMLSSKDINFVGYTYKNFEIVNDHQLPGIGIDLPLLMLACIFLVELPYLLFGNDFYMTFMCSYNS